MARPAAKDLTERELEVMHVFWAGGELTAADARDRLAAGGRELSYPTVANLVRALQDKGFLAPVNDERPFRYVPARSYEDVSGRLLTDLVSRVFGGSREQLFVRLLDGRKLTPQRTGGPRSPLAGGPGVTDFGPLLLALAAQVTLPLVGGLILSRRRDPAAACGPLAVALVAVLALTPLALAAPAGLVDGRDGGPLSRPDVTTEASRRHRPGPDRRRGEHPRSAAAGEAGEGRRSTAPVRRLGRRCVDRSSASRPSGRRRLALRRVSSIDPDRAAKHRPSRSRLDGGLRRTAFQPSASAERFACARRPTSGAPRRRAGSAGGPRVAGLANVEPGGDAGRPRPRAGPRRPRRLRDPARRPVGGGRPRVSPVRAMGGRPARTATRDGGRRPGRGVVRRSARLPEMSRGPGPEGRRRRQSARYRRSCLARGPCYGGSPCCASRTTPRFGVAGGRPWPRSACSRPPPSGCTAHTRAALAGPVIRVKAEEETRRAPLDVSYVFPADDKDFVGVYAGRVGELLKTPGRRRWSNNTRRSSRRRSARTRGRSSS